MQSWNFPASTPQIFTLSTDARLGQTDYPNDQIWDLIIGGGDPPAISLQTTFGLRARQMNLFLRFLRKNEIITDPARFFRRPEVKSCTPSSILIDFSPFSGVDVQAEYWLPASQIVTGRISLHNRSILPEHFRLELAGVLAPLAEGEGLAVIPFGVTHVLQGRSSGLVPVCFMTGGPQPGVGPYSALSVEMELLPGNTRQLTWALVSLGDRDTSFDLARRTTARPWEAEIARVELQHNALELKITTGDPEWNTAFELSQRLANSLLMNGGSLPATSFVLTRRPDQGYSARGDGGDYNYLWNGQTGLDTYYLASQLLPGGEETVRGWMENFLATCEAGGQVEWKPGLAGQRSHRLAQPLLATLAWQLARHQTDDSWLQRVYPSLLSFFNAWFSPEHDRDGDGYPEWDHPFQSGAEDVPIYDRWHPQAQGVEIEALEAPSLGALLYRECRSLMQIARRTANEVDLPWLEQRAETLRAAVASTWDDTAHTYRYRDTHTHLSTGRVELLRFNGSGRFASRRKFSTPQRLLLRLQTGDAANRPVRALIFGSDSQGDITEEILPARFTWVNGHACATSHQTFLSLKRLVIENLQEGDSGDLATVDYSMEDATLLLPLWAGIPDETRAAALVEETILKRYARDYGIALCPATNCPSDLVSLSCLNMPWNQLILEGLVRYGYRRQAADLFIRQMNAVLHTFRQSGVFRESIHAGTAQPFGERNHLHGLIPTGLFLQILGVQVVRPDEVILQDINPFPWPVTVKYQGMTITRHSQDTVVTFPGGQVISVTGPEAQRVTLSQSEAPGKEPNE